MSELAEQTSPYAKQLQDGFRTLRFGAPLESEFRQHHLKNVRRRIMVCLMIGFAFSLWLAIASGGSSRPEAAAEIPDFLRTFKTWVVRPLTLFMFATVFMRTLYLKTWLFTAPAVMGLSGIVGGFSVAAIVAAGNFHAFVAMISGMLVFYMLMGLLLGQVILIGIAICSAYVASLIYHGASADVVQYEATVMIAMTAMCLVFQHGLERSLRTSFLQRRVLEDLGNRDALTGLSNRRAFDNALQALWQQGMRDEKPLALLMIDVDYFKNFNDAYGHQAGDRCLQTIGRVLVDAQRRAFDVAARFGGEEFVLLLYAANVGHVNAVAEQIMSAIRQEAIAHNRSKTADVVTVSIGAAQVVPKIGRSSASLVQFADEALYQAKDNGRNCLVWQDDGYEDLVTGAFQIRRQD